ncbi:MAG: TatD family hydrolase [Bacteroidota bacterium]
MFLNFHTHFSKNPSLEILNVEQDDFESKSYFSIAYHPKDCLNFTDFSSALDSEFCLAIGETGLDKTITVSFEVQKEVFIKHIALSENFKLPLIIHCVKAWNEILKLKKELKPKQKWIFHGFRKTTLLASVLENDVLIGIGSAILFDKKLQEALKLIPLEKILLETDDNETVTIEEIYMKVAQIKNISLQNLKEQILLNFLETFQKFSYEFEVSS